MNSKERLLALIKLLWTQTDEEHPMTTAEIVTYFENQGVSTYRKTVQADIELLIEFGLDIVEIKRTQISYFCATRCFELPELKLLIDAIESSKFITAKKNRELVSKLASFSSTYQADSLKRQLYSYGRIKPENENIYYIIDLLHAAIRDKKKISFRYYEYTPQKEKVWKHNGVPYKFSPYALFWNEDRYYIIGYSDNHGKIVKFRVDRMEIPKDINETAVEQPENFDASEYAVKVFDMYDGRTTKVKLLCDNTLIKVVIDRFGEDITVTEYDETRFMVEVEVSTSPTFFGWIFQFGRKVQIYSPTEVLDEYRNRIAEIHQNI